jgi:hypothetical protein
VDSKPRGNLTRLLPLGLWLGALMVLGYHLAVEVTSIGLPEPMGFWETAYASIARVFPHEYQPGNFVLGHDNYGPGYPAFCRPFLALIADPYVAHRVANLVALVLACAVLTRLLRQNRASRAVTAGIVAIFYALNAGSYSIQARPDFLVLLLMTAVWAVGQGAIRGRFRPGWSGVLLGLFSLAAYLTKPYSLFAWGAVLVAVALCFSWRHALVAGVISAAIIAAGIAAYAHANPYYLLETFHAHVAHTSPDFPWLLHQSGDFLLLTGGLILAAVAGVAFPPRPRPAGDGAPVVPDASARYWRVNTALAVVVLWGALGWHTGAYLTYFLHLLLVPLCLAAATSERPVTSLFLLANLAVLMVLAPPMPRTDPGWAPLAEDVRHQIGPVVVDSLMEPLARGRRDVRVADTGLEAYALDEAGLIDPHLAGMTRVRGEARDFQAEQAALLSRSPPDAIYLDFVATPNPRGKPGDLVYSPRNELPWYSAEYLGQFVPIRSFHLHPYYYSTNGRRQDAANWETLIIKFVPKRKP